MATTYYVRIYCDDCDEYKYTTQTTVDDTWKPEGCSTHTTRDFVVEYTEITI